MTEENNPEPLAIIAGSFYILPVTVDVNRGKAVATLNWEKVSEYYGHQFISDAGTYLIRASYEGVDGSAETTFFLTLTGSR